MDRMDFSSIGTTYEKWNKFSASARLEEDLSWYGRAFYIKGKASLVKMEVKQNAQKYYEILEKRLLQFLANNYQNDTIFQQDHAAIHKAKLTTKWLQDHNIATLNWPAKSPELNPIENLWGILARQVYADGRRFEDKEMLWCAVKECWEAIFNETLSNLINSMNNRCVDVLKSKGSSYEYSSAYLFFSEFIFAF